VQSYRKHYPAEKKTWYQTNAQFYMQQQPDILERHVGYTQHPQVTMV